MPPGSKLLAQTPLDCCAIEAAAAEFAKSFDSTDSSSPFWIQSQAGTSLLSLRKVRVGPLWIRCGRSWKRLKKSPPPPMRFTNGGPREEVPGEPAGRYVHDVRVHIRGTYSRLGDLVPRHFPVILAAESQPKIATGSGRRELADWLASPENVLTPRVIVNRVWQHHFGRGIVPTASNFGKLGERPTHPELLDALARWFLSNGWSLKRLHREIMLSSTYRQSSLPSDGVLQADPGNRFLGRMNRLRLESEAIRDSLLAVAGRLDPASRRSVHPRFQHSAAGPFYLMTIRSDRSGFGPLLDVADPTAMVDTRAVSTVAPQALCASTIPSSWSRPRRSRGESSDQGPVDRARIDHAYSLLYARLPRDDERQLRLDLVKVPGSEVERQAAWEAYCQVLLCA